MTIKKGSIGKRFPIFNSPESLYVWLHDPMLQNEKRLDPTLGTTIFLRPGETMEIEWMGCEFIHEERSLRVDQIRLAKTMKVKSLALESLIGLHQGWIISDIISFNNESDENVKKVKLTQKSKHKFDIQHLFSTRGLIEDEPILSHPQDLQ